MDVVAGRTSTFDVGAKSQDKVTILEQPDFGTLSVNPDNTLALVLDDPDRTGDLIFSIEVESSDRTIQTTSYTLTATPGTQDAGWGSGDFYMLETDASGDLVIEHGDNHRSVYVSESADALSKADIAAREGLKEGKITKWWLAEHEEYGNEFNPLATDVGMQLWYHIEDRATEPTSNHLLFERGYEYENTGRLIPRGAEGEDELHPVYIGAWGEGEAPVIADTPNLYQKTAKNVVVEGLSFADGFQILTGKNILLSDVTVTGDDLNVQRADGFTLRNSEVVDVYLEEPVRGGKHWEASINRASGSFLTLSENALFDNVLFDHNGWADGYDYNRSTADGQPPSFYNHNLYIAHDNTDVTVRDNLFLQGASFGMQLRSGGVVEDNVFADNNIGLNILGGDYRGAGNIGNYSLVLDNVVTSAGYKTVDKHAGAPAGGLLDYASKTTLLGNIVANLANPADAKDVARKEYRWDDLETGEGDSDPFHDDTIVWNWIGSADRVGRRNDVNVDGLDPARLDSTTIQAFADKYLDTRGATVGDLADALREDGHTGVADEIVDWFQKGFGIETSQRITDTTLRFVPNDLAEGFRWDNRLNWDTGDLPGTVDGDSVDLGGNRVNYDGTNTIVDFDLGAGGHLEVNHGKLTVEGDLDTGRGGGAFGISAAGQVWVNGYDGRQHLTVDVDGGRFVNTGRFDGQFTIGAGDGQTILATHAATMVFGLGDEMVIEGSDAKIGFDGDRGTAKLEIDAGSELTFRADKNGVAEIREFRSGRFDDGQNVSSKIDIDGGTLKLDLSQFKKHGELTLLSADEITGLFDTVEIEGLGKSRDAHLIMDYDADELHLVVTRGGNGKSDFSISGKEFSALDFDPGWKGAYQGPGASIIDLDRDKLDDVPASLHQEFFDGL